MTGFQAPWYTCFTPTSRIPSAARAFIGVKRVGTPAPKSLITPETDSLATYWSILAARKTRTASPAPARAAWASSASRSADEPNLPEYMSRVSSSIPRSRSSSTRGC